MNSLETLLADTIGYLHLVVTPYSPGDKLQPVKIDNQLFSIIQGIYISPYVGSLFKDNSTFIDGILLDTTWKLINKYVTSIIMVYSLNVGISCGFAFGGAEDSDLYNQFIDKFQEKLNVNLKQYYCESDQGSALRSDCDSFDKPHLACLRHFKVGLKTKAHSSAICEIISCKTTAELETLLEYYSSKFDEITDRNDLKSLQRFAQSWLDI